MRTRFRTLAALLALFAFSASFAEQVRAGTCAPAAVEQAGHHAAAHGHADGGHGVAHPPDAPAHHRTPDDGCPLQAASGGCVLFPSAPPVRKAAPAAAAPPTLISPATDPSRELLLAASFFRPPQR